MANARLQVVLQTRCGFIVVAVEVDEGGHIGSAYTPVKEGLRNVGVSSGGLRRQVAVEVAAAVGVAGGGSSGRLQCHGGRWRHPCPRP